LYVPPLRPPRGVRLQAGTDNERVLALASGALTLLSTAFAAQAMAAAVPVSMTFTEPFIPGIHSAAQ
jgi:hypothetical protein